MAGQDLFSGEHEQGFIDLPVASAARNNDVDQVEALIKDGVNINQQNKYCHSALHVASARGYEEIVDILLKAGANMRTRCRDGYTPIEVAITYDRANIIVRLLEAGSDINQCTHGETLLHVAAGNRRVNSVRVLLDHGIDANRQSIYGYTALKMMRDRYPQYEGRDEERDEGRDEGNKVSEIIELLKLAQHTMIKPTRHT